MKTTVGERLISIASNFKLTNKRLAEVIGQKETTVNQWVLNNKWSDVEKLESVLAKFPSINRDWLYGGEGEMIKKGSSYNREPQISLASDNGDCYGCMIKDGIISEYRNQISASIAKLVSVTESIKQCNGTEKKRKAC